MRFWVSRQSGLSLGRQLSTQIVLAIASGDLQPGERLPSTRELAQRLRVHANTVSAVYRDLQRRGWLRVRKGSGVFVGAGDAAEEAAATDLDTMTLRFIRSALAAGNSRPAIRQAVQHWLVQPPPDHLLLVESDPELRSLLEAEIRRATDWPVACCTPEDCGRHPMLDRALPVYLLNWERQLRRVLPPGTEGLALRTSSAQEALRGRSIPSNALIGVVSRWNRFVELARTMLVAAGADPESIFACDPRRRNWAHRLRACAAVIADVRYGEQIPPGPRVFIFTVIAESSLAELSSKLERLLHRA